MPGEIIDLRQVFRCLRQKREFPFDGLQHEVLDDWANALRSAPAVAVSMTWYELLVAMQLHAKVFGVLKNKDGSWAFQRHLGKPFDFKTSGRAFGKFTRDAIRLAYPDWRPINGRPQCPSFRNWTGTVQVWCAITGEIRFGLTLRGPSMGLMPETSEPP